MQRTQHASEWHHGAMQLLVRDLPRGGQLLDFAEVPQGADPFQLESPEVHVPRLGSPDLLKLATELIRSGSFRVLEVDVRDADMNPPNGELLADVAHLLKDALDSGDLVSARSILQSTGPRKLYAVSFMLAQKGGPLAIEVGRDGYFVERPRPDESARELLREAWQISGVS
jgi:hypothetical protein